MEIPKLSWRHKALLTFHQNDIKIGNALLYGNTQVIPETQSIIITDD